MTHRIDSAMNDCVEGCLRCYSVCLGSAMHHCLETRGRHFAPPHFRLMMACVEICRTSAHFMLLGSSHHKHTCRECAEICAECADDCECLGGMEACVQACRRCAESCGAMAAAYPFRAARAGVLDYRAPVRRRRDAASVKVLF